MIELVWGLCGGSGSGKTTLAEALGDRLGADAATIMSVDSYYSDLGALTQTEREAVDFDHPASIDGALMAEHVAALKTGRAVERPVYDFSTHTRTGTVRIRPRSHLIIEGVLLFAFPDVVDLLDIAVFLDVPEAVRFERRLRRDVSERGRSAEEVTNRWSDHVQPGHLAHVQAHVGRAHLVLEHGGTPDDHVSRLLTAARDGRPGAPPSR